nr:uncharacterized protein LOC127332506 [Lolium perenne]
MLNKVWGKSDEEMQELTDLEDGLRVFFAKHKEVRQHPPAAAHQSPQVPAQSRANHQARLQATLPLDPARTTRASRLRSSIAPGLHQRLLAACAAPPARKPLPPAHAQVEHARTSCTTARLAPAQLHHSTPPRPPAPTPHRPTRPQAPAQPSQAQTGRPGGTPGHPVETGAQTGAIRRNPGAPSGPGPGLDRARQSQIRFDRVLDRTGKNSFFSEGQRPHAPSTCASIRSPRWPTTAPPHRPNSAARTRLSAPGLAPAAAPHRAPALHDLLGRSTLPLLSNRATSPDHHTALLRPRARPPLATPLTRPRAQPVPNALPLPTGPATTPHRTQQQQSTRPPARIARPHLHHARVSAPGPASAHTPAHFRSDRSPTSDRSF